VPKKILIIDDEPLIVEMLAFRLQKAAGYSVFSAGDGEEGLKQAKAQNPDLILVDIMMPRMDGYEFLKQVKKDPELARIPVIILTASISAEVVDQAKKAGAVDFILKPFNSAQLQQKIEKVIANG